MAQKWNEGKIGRILARDIFNSDLCVLPNCTWTGNEIDLFVLTTDLYIIDVEIKISRADLKIDKEKDKWWTKSWGKYNPATQLYERPAPTPKVYPTKTWKHYYAMPKSIWKDDLLEHIQPISGILLIDDFERVSCIKRATPNRKATKVETEHAIEIARLTSFRMWKAYERTDKLLLEKEKLSPNISPTT